MRYIDVCSGISAPTAAWKPLGWQALCYAEIEAAPRAVLAHHYPDVPLVGDFTQIQGTEYGPVDLLVGGTPCQSFSIAGLRGGLADDRGNLALEYLRLADRARPRWLVWENVPGVLSSNGGRDFGAILGGLAELGYGFAYRILDAQHFGVPQRRRRVFVVGYLGDWRRAAAVLFERHSLSGHPAPRREARQVAPTIPSRSTGGGGLGTDFDCDGGLIAEAFGGGNTRGAVDVAACLVAKGQKCDFEVETFIAHSLRGEGFDASEDGTGRGTPLVPVAFDCKGTQVQFTTDGVHPTLRSMGRKDSHSNAGGHAAVAFSIMPMNSGKDYKARETDIAQPIMAGGPVGGNQGGDYVCQTVAATIETMYGVTHADAAQTHPDQALRALRDAVGEKTYSKWCAGILAAFRTPEILRSKVHGASVRWARDDWHELGDDALSCPEDGSSWPMLALWQAGCIGRAPRGWEPSEQLARELVAHLSELPHQRTSAARFLLGLWRTCEGLGLLREALSALQEAWRSEQGQSQPARLTSAVRRLTPRECERLMGFPDDFTLVPYRGRMMADGPRYKMLGNSMAVPVMRWIGERIAKVDALTIAERQAA